MSVVRYDALSLSFAGDKYLGRPYSEMDCQAFVERCMADIGYRRDLAGSNAWYRVMDWTGTPEECVRVFGCVPKGALLFILKDDGREPGKYKNDGIGNSSHIGIKTGRGDGAINSSSSRGCVATSVFKDKSIRGGWNRVGLLKDFDYGKSINWILEHGGESQPDDQKDEVRQMQGVVTAQSGTTVNLRKKPDGDLVERIPVGTEVMITEYGPEWCRVTAGNWTGYMMTKFIDIQGDVTPGDDPDEDFTPGDQDEAEPGGNVILQVSYEAAANAYPFLRALCDQIERKVGRG